MKKISLPVFFILLLEACQPITLPPSGNDLAQPPATPSASMAQTPIFLAQEAGSSLAEVTRLAERWRNSLLAEPGWLYLKRQVERGDNFSSSWDALPDRYLEETWLLLGVNSTVQTAVRQESSEAGQVLQQSLYQGGTWRNLTLGAVSELAPGLLLELDYGFTTLAARLNEAGATLNRQTLYNNCWYIGEKYMIGEPPYSYAAVFNPDSGMLRQLAVWEVNSGAVALVSQVNVITQEKISQPPADVLSLIAMMESGSSSWSVQPLSLALP